MGLSYEWNRIRKIIIAAPIGSVLRLFRIARPITDLNTARCFTADFGPRPGLAGTTGRFCSVAITRTTRTTDNSYESEF